MADALFESNWQPTKDALCEGLTGNKRTVMETTLENTRQALLETAGAGATNAGNVATLNKVILPVIRRVMPTVIANELIGVQPMTGPVGQIHTLRVRYADTNDGVTAGEEALSPFKIANTYSGAPAASSATAPSPTGTMEGIPGNKMSIQILKQTVEAKTHADYPHVGPSKHHKMLSHSTASMLKPKLWPLLLKRLQLKLTKKFLVH